MSEPNTTLNWDRLRGFKYRVKIIYDRLVEPACLWCEDHYGPPGLRWEWDVSTDFQSEMIRKGAFYVFAFRTEPEALMFALRWL